MGISLGSVVLCDAHLVRTGRRVCLVTRLGYPCVTQQSRFRLEMIASSIMNQFGSKEKQLENRLLVALCGPHVRITAVTVQKFRYILLRVRNPIVCAGIEAVV